MCDDPLDCLAVKRDQTGSRMTVSTVRGRARGDILGPDQRSCPSAEMRFPGMSCGDGSKFHRDAHRSGARLMVAHSRRVVSGMVTGSPPGRSTYEVLNDRVKAMLDLVVATVLLVLASPIILLCLIAVRLGSKGSPLYSQKRLGSRGRIITIYKIRTMYEDCERNYGPMWSGPGDPRVTPLGRILRATHLDELPQLLNVARGEMSLIGPRPERPEIVVQLERCFPAYRDRLLVRPGLSGLAQIIQGPDTSLHGVQTKLRYDNYYVVNHGFWLDSRIGLATLLYLLWIPGPIIARIFRFPIYDLLPAEASPQGEGIAVRSGVQPEYAN